MSNVAHYPTLTPWTTEPNVASIMTVKTLVAHAMVAEFKAQTQQIAALERNSLIVRRIGLIV